MYSPSVVICKGLGNYFVCLLIVDKLMRPDVLLFGGLVERLDVPIFVFLDELMFAYAQGLDCAPKVVAGVLVSVVSA